GEQAEASWRWRFAAYARAHPAEAAAFERRMRGDLPAAFDAHVATLAAQVQAKAAAVATRKASQDCLEALAPHLPELIGGSADLSWSNLTPWSGSRAVARH